MKVAVGQKIDVQHRNTDNKHVTTGKHSDKEELRQLLQDNPVLGSVLSEIETLVNEALDVSEEL